MCVSGNSMLLFPVIFPIIAGLIFLTVKGQKQQQIYIVSVIFLEALIAIYLCVTKSDSFTFWHMNKNVFILLQTDKLSQFFVCLMNIIDLKIWELI